MILALLVGFVTGWLVSMPIGPVNAAVISRTLKYNVRHGLAVGIGAAIMDVIYCGGAAQINEFLLSSPIVNLAFQLVGFAALLFLGVRQLRQLRTKTKEEEAATGRGEKLEYMAMETMHLPKRSLLGPFVLGILLYATNVMAIPEWVVIAHFWRSLGLLEVGFGINVAFAVGAGLGTAGWFMLLVRWISKRHHGFKPETLRKINFGTAIAMLVFSAYFAYAIIFQTHWGQVLSHAEKNTELYLSH